MALCAGISEPSTTLNRTPPLRRCTPLRLQYVRKISGSTKPSKANEEAFDEAVHEIAHITQHLLDSLVSHAPAKDRDEEAAKARARAAVRFGTA